MDQIQLLQNIKLIVGLGNPGKKYANTWHNVGFIFIDTLRNLLEEDSEITIENKKEYELTKGKISLLKPLTFMNKSGDVLAEFLRFNKYEPDEILIVHDDLDITLGNFKIQQGKYPKQHNGISSIHERTGETNFLYLRIGVETRDKLMQSRISGHNYVLKKLTKEQRENLEKTLQKVYNDYMKIQVLNNNNNSNAG